MAAQRAVPLPINTEKTNLMSSIDDLPRSVWGVQPEAVEEHLSGLVARCQAAEAQLADWRHRAIRAEAALKHAQPTPATEGSGVPSGTRHEAALILQRAEAEAKARKARWAEDLQAAEDELATTRSQIDALRKDFHALLEGVATAVARRDATPT